MPNANRPRLLRLAVILPAIAVLALAPALATLIFSTRAAGAEPAATSVVPSLHDQSRLLRAAQKGQSKLQDIELHGRIEDQNGTAVAGVEIIYDAGGMYLAAGSGRGKTVSDESGRFHIRGARGVDLHVAHLRKPGYQFEVSDGEAGSVRNPRRLHSGQWKAYSADNPAVFVLWKASQFPRLTKGQKNLYLQPGAGDYTLEFFDGAAGFEPAAAGGDLRIACSRDEQRWSVHISAVDGGLQLQSGVYPYTAPENGYAPTLDYADNRLLSDVYTTLYFRSSGGQVHGYLNLHLVPYHSEDCAIQMRYVVNREGSRDLTVEIPDPYANSE